MNAKLQTWQITMADRPVHSYYLTENRPADERDARFPSSAALSRTLLAAIPSSSTANATLPEQATRHRLKLTVA